MSSSNHPIQVIANVAPLTPAALATTRALGHEPNGPLASARYPGPTPAPPASTTGPSTPATRATTSPAVDSPKAAAAT